MGENGEIPPELAEMVNEIVPQFIPKILAEEANVRKVGNVHVSKPHPTLSTMAKKATTTQHNSTDRVWDARDIDNGMTFSTPLANVSVGDVKVHVKKDLLRVTGTDGSGKAFAFVYPVS